MIESRCGTKCSECMYKEKVNCVGCVSMNKPFWGEKCLVKNCCENKNLEFCGQCKDFPCELLKEFSFDKEHGDNGIRIENCKIWLETIS